MHNLNIVELIEKNPISKLSQTYNNKLLDRIKSNFSNFEQQLFISSFYCYLNYDKNNDFVIDLDNVWKWIGFSQKIDAKRLLEKHFTNNIDYNLTLGLTKASLEGEKWGGHNKQTIMITIKCFKSLCLKAQTKKASEIHEYYMNLEEILHETLEEETNELKNQLQLKDNIIIQKEQEKQKAIEETLIKQFTINTECVYFGIINNTNESNEKLIKFGHTNNLQIRVLDHRKNYDNFILLEAFKVHNKVEIENLIKIHTEIKKHIRTIEVNGKNKTEIIAYDDTFTIEKLTKYIKEIINSRTYSIDNFNKLLKRNQELDDENRLLNDNNKNLETIITKLTLELNKYKEKNECLQKKLDSVKDDNQSIYQNALLPEDEINKNFNDFISNICIVRPDVEEMSVNIEGRFRLWNRSKPTKEMFHALKNYLDTRFKPKRINGHHGYIGVKLKTIEYKKTQCNSPVETFIFQVCKFSDCGKILNSTLLREYQKWKLSINKELADNDMKDIKDYLNEAPYVLKATVWTEEGGNEGYYGLSLNTNEIKPRISSSTGKNVYKREVNTNELLGFWNTVYEASKNEGISNAKMSRNIKNKIIIKDYYYSVC